MTKTFIQVNSSQLNIVSVNRISLFILKAPNVIPNGQLHKQSRKPFFYVKTTSLYKSKTILRSQKSAI